MVLDPFCGRGTTAYAARYLGLPSYSIDSSPVAVAIARAKLASSTLSRVLGLAQRFLQLPVEYHTPAGDFWRMAYHGDTLDQICHLRAALLAPVEAGGCPCRGPITIRELMPDTALGVEWPLVAPKLP
jgi:hypothetical protein